MATAQTNEQRLDQAESLIKQVLKDVRANNMHYNKADYKALEQAWVALNKVTLRKDI